MKTAYPNLSRAPIIEGLIHMQFKPRQGSNIEDLKGFIERIKANYPNLQELRGVRAQVTFSPSQATSQSVPSELVGYRFERQLPNFVVQAKATELLVSRLKPYSEWEELLKETRSILGAYSDACKPEAITRVATRFINEINLPIERLDFDHYLTAAPKIPGPLPQVVEQFWTRVVVPEEHTGTHIAITQVLGPPNPNTNTMGVLMDIDVYKELELPVLSDELWVLLDKMRDVKNSAFFGGLTEKAIKLFQ